MEIFNEIFSIGLVLLPLKPPAGLLWTLVRAGASILRNSGSFMPRCSKEKHEFQTNTAGLVSKHRRYVLYFPQMHLPQIQGSTFTWFATIKVSYIADMP